MAADPKSKHPRIPTAQRWAKDTWPETAVEEVEFENPAQKGGVGSGDLPGHEFRGNQYTAYHGTSAENAEKIRQGGFVSDKGKNGQLLGAGVYLTGKRHIAESYGGEVLETDISHLEVKDFPSETKYKQFLHKRGISDWEPETMSQMMQDLGYDAVRIDNNITVVFNPAKLKVKEKSDATQKGGFGSGDLPGHEFRGNQWTGGKPSSGNIHHQYPEGMTDPKEKKKFRQQQRKLLKIAKPPMVEGQQKKLSDYKTMDLLEYSKWGDHARNTRTDEERAAETAYCNGSYKSLNYHLREHIPLNASQQHWADNLDSRFAEGRGARAPKDVLLYRGTPVQDEWRPLLEKAAVNKDFKLIWHDEGYLSTTNRKTVAKGWGNVFFQIYTPAGTPCFPADYNQIGNSGEGEVLFPRDSRFIIRDVRKVGSSYHVDMEFYDIKKD